MGSPDKGQESDSDKTRLVASEVVSLRAYDHMQRVRHVGMGHGLAIVVGRAARQGIG